jgi:hypothetical protein
MKIVNQIDLEPQFFTKVPRSLNSRRRHHAPWPLVALGMILAGPFVVLWRALTRYGR